MYFVYILANQRNTVLYTGVTNNLESRVFDHKVKRNRGFTAKYNCDKLVYYEEFEDILEAIQREKQLKRYHRNWKIELIEKSSPLWKDLSEGWFEQKEFDLYRKVKR